MTTDILLREDTGSFAPVRVIDPDQPVSAPYSRAVGLLDRWVRDSRHAVDEFAAWIEGQAAQVAAEMRQLCDELELPHVQAASVQWAELPERDWKPGDPLPLPPLPDEAYPPGAEPLPDPVAAYMAADDSDDLPGRRATWVNVDGEPGVMPGQVVRVALPPRDNPLAVAYAEREARGWTPVPPGRPVDDPMYARAFIPLPHKKPTKNRLAKRRLRRGLRHLGEHGPYNPVVRRIDAVLERWDDWLRVKQAETDKRMGAAE